MQKLGNFGWLTAGRARIASLAIVLTAVFSLSACYDKFTLSSPDIGPDGVIKNAQVYNSFGCTGNNQSPRLEWKNAPDAAKSFVVTMYDPDAPTGSGFWHWTVLDLPGSTRSLGSNAGAAGNAGLPAGALQGYTDYGTSAYGGPCPPVGDKPHHYVFTVYAMNIASTGLTAGAPGALVSFVAKANSIASASFTATFGRAGPPTTAYVPNTPAGFTLSSTEVPANSTIGNNQVYNGFGCTGGNISPSLGWSGVPAGAQSLVLTMYDPDAPTGSGFWHWLVFNIPPAASSISLGAGVLNSATLPTGAGQGYTDFGASAYGGPCPPAGDKPHHYIFTLYALSILDVTAVVGPNPSGSLLGFVTLANATAQTSFTATYGR